MKTFIVIILATLAVAIGETLLSKGMKQMGDVSSLPWTQLWKMLRMFTHPMVLLGMLFMAGFFFAYAAALSWADLSYVMPATALSFVFGTLLAKFYLNEQVSGWRWAGLALIILGILLVWMDERQLTVDVSVP